MSAPVLPPVGPDWQTWARQVSTYIRRQMPRLQTRTTGETPAEDGILLWDRAGYPVVSINGKWRPLALQSSENTDAFGRLRVSNPQTIFDSQLQYDKQPLLWVEKDVGSGSSTHLPNESAVDMDVTTASGDSVIRQTREFFRYQPGKSQQIFCTGVLGTAQANTNKLVGYGETKNGAFFGQDGGGTYVLLRSYSGGSVDDSRKVYQADWSEDVLDGQGDSGETADWSKTHIFTIDLEWLGVGLVRMGVVVGGQFITVHKFKNANLQTTTYMTTANLPVRYEITNTGVAAAGSTLKQICAQVSTEGGLDNLQKYPFATYQAGVSVPNGAANATMPFVAQHAATFNGIENRGLFVPVGYEILATSGTIYAEVIYNPTLTGGTFGAVDSNSFMEGAADVGTAFSGGTVIDNGVTGASGKNKVGVVEQRGLSSRLPFGLDIDGANPTPLGLKVHALTNSVTCDLAFFWAEVR